MFQYNLTSTPSFDINNKVIDNIFKTTYKLVNIGQSGTINIVFLDPLSIQKLNNNYRKINKTTDVLSFHYYENFENLKDSDIAGEIIINEEKIKSQAIEFGLGNEKEFYKILIHSILHILGYDHELDSDYKIMQEFENKIWNKVFEK